MFSDRGQLIGSKSGLNQEELPLKIFDCTVFVHVPTHLQSKFDPRAEKCTFLGNAPNKKGYKCFNPSTRKIHLSVDVNFIENFPFL